MPKLLKPDQMTPEERNREVAEIFARAFLRTRFPNPAPATAPEQTQSHSTKEEPCKQH